MALHAGAALASQGASALLLEADTTVHESTDVDMIDAETADALLQTSRAQDLLGIIEAEADRRSHNRVTAVGDVARRTLVDTQQAAEELAADLLAVEDTRLRASTDFSVRAETTMHEAERRFRAGLDEIFAVLRGWEDVHHRRRQRSLSEAWEQTEADLRTAIDQHFTRTGGWLREELTGVADAVAVGWEARFDQLQARHRPGTVGWRAPWMDTAIRYAIHGAAAAVISAAGILLPVVPQSIPKLVKVAEAGLLQKLNLRKRRFQRRQTLQRQITTIRDEMFQEAVADWTNDCEPIQAALNQRVDIEVASAATAGAAAKDAARLARRAERSIAEVDGALVRGLLRLEGHDRAADGAGRVVRRPGLASTVSFDDPALLDDLLLWPPTSGAEAIRPVPHGSMATPARQAAHALAIGRRGGVILPADDGLVATVADGSSAAFLRAEARLVTATAGVLVTLRPGPTSNPTRDPMYDLTRAM